MRCRCTSTVYPESVLERTRNALASSQSISHVSSLICLHYVCNMNKSALR